MSSHIKPPNQLIMQVNSLITEATLLLLEKKPYNKITVSDITNKAGIARRTFYRNYKEKDEVLMRYFANIINPEILTVENISDTNNQEVILLTFNMNFIRNNHSDIKKILSAVGGNILFLNRFNDLVDILIARGRKKLASTAQLVYKYKMFYQMTGICKIVWDWILNDMPVSCEDLIKILNCFTVDTKNKYPNIPNIMIKIAEN
jgi:hypothetical protein